MLKSILSGVLIGSLQSLIFFGSFSLLLSSEKLSLTKEWFYKYLYCGLPIGVFFGFLGGWKMKTSFPKDYFYYWTLTVCFSAAWITCWENIQNIFLVRMALAVILFSSFVIFKFYISEQLRALNL